MNVAVKVTPSETRDSGKVRMGSLSPSFPAVRATPVQTADSGKVRMGSLSPSFPAVRTRRRKPPTAARCDGLAEPELPGGPHNAGADRRQRQGPHGCTRARRRNAGLDRIRWAHPLIRRRSATAASLRLFCLRPSRGVTRP